MKVIKLLYRFLASIQFAILLISSVAFFVIGGTFIESWTQSHRYAAHFTYSNPIFIGLLCCFFVNILFSALRRWPFRIKHIPFLTTHLGLLMLLSGALIKSVYGVQGSMGVMEGSGSQEIFVPESLALRIEKRGSKDLTDLKNLQDSPSLVNYAFLPARATTIRPFEDLDIQLVAYSPHSSECLDTWIKGNYVHIMGLQPFIVHEWQENNNFDPLPISSRVHIAHAFSEPCDLMAFRTTDVTELAKKVYLQGLNVVISDQFTKKIIFQGLLIDALNSPVNMPEIGRAVFELHFSYSSILGFEDPALLVSFNRKGVFQKIVIPLEGTYALQNVDANTLEIGTSAIAVKLQRQPTIAFLQDNQNDIFLFAFDPHGKVYSQSFRNDNLNSYIAYDGGFGGYAVQAKIFDDIILETSLAPRRKEEIPLQKIENNSPKITLQLRIKGKTEFLTLTYDRYAQGLKWPVFDGEYALRFQPMFQELPYRVRLRGARQINYPHSAQPYSYESDIKITDIKKSSSLETTISMNQVHETSNGYRFYLAGIAPSNESAIKRIQIVVNYDPAKYLLTYPGAIVLTLGILLLFWMRPYRHSSS